MCSKLFYPKSENINIWHVVILLILQSYSFGFNYKTFFYLLFFQNTWRSKTDTFLCIFTCFKLWKERENSQKYFISDFPSHKRSWLLFVTQALMYRGRKTRQWWCGCGSAVRAACLPIWRFTVIYCKSYLLYYPLQYYNSCTVFPLVVLLLYFNLLCYYCIINYRITIFVFFSITVLLFFHIQYHWCFFQLTITVKSHLL